MIETTKFRKWVGAAAVAVACSTMASTGALAEPQKGGTPVSYTHLTLPTICSV